MNLILIGLRGSGKTTVGRLVAARLSRPFVDLDDVVAVRMGAATVAEAWRMHGEPKFREAETKALRDILKNNGQVLALGGGTPTAAGAAELLRAEKGAGSATIIYLAGAGPTLRARLAKTDISARPSLTGADPLAEIEAVLGQRDRLFRELADLVVATDGLTVEQVAVRVEGVAGLSV